MKLLLLLLILSFSVSAFSQELSGTIWALSGVGCRDASLNPNTHIFKPPSSADISVGIIYFKDDRNVNITETVQGKEESYSGTYRVNGDEVNFRGKGGGMTMYMQRERLVVIGNRVEAERNVVMFNGLRIGGELNEELKKKVKETWQEHKRRNNLDIDEEWTARTREELISLENKCLREKPFVYVLGRVN